MTAETIVEQEEGAVPAPPPPPVQEHSGENFNPNLSRGLFRIWDVVAVFGPLTDTDVRLKVGMVQGAWQEYVRYHPGTVEADAERLRLSSNNWYLDHEIGIGLKHKYLKRDRDGSLVIGECPPAHTPPTKDEVRQMLLREDNLTALAILRNKTDPARMEPIPARFEALKASLKTYGQVYPILRWKDGGNWIIVDGATREKAMLELGKKPTYDDTRYAKAQAIDVLMVRIDLELNGRTKSDTERSRNAYIANLAKQGFTQKAIAEKVGLSDRHVRRVLSQKDMNVLMTQRDTPPAATVQEWVRLNDGGWSTRDIAEDYVWSQSTVSRRIREYREALTSGTPVPDPEPAPEPEGLGARAIRILVAIAMCGGENVGRDDILTYVTPNQATGGKGFDLLIDGGYVTKSKVGTRMYYTLTEKGEEEEKKHPRLTAIKTAPTPTPPTPAPTPTVAVDQEIDDPRSILEAGMRSLIQEAVTNGMSGAEILDVIVSLHDLIPK